MADNYKGGPQFDDRFDTSVQIPGTPTNATPLYYYRIELTFMKGDEPAYNVSYGGSYTSYYSNGSTATNIIPQTTLGAQKNSVILNLYSYKKEMPGALTINAKIVGSTTVTTKTFGFKYSNKTSITGIVPQLAPIQMTDGDIILPSIYKPFFFKAALLFTENPEVFNFYFGIANGTPYRMNDGNYIIGRPVLTIDNQSFYFYNEPSNINYIRYTKTEDSSKYFYVPKENVQTLTNMFQYGSNVTIDNPGIDPTLPHNYSFSVTEGVPIGYSGDLDIAVAEDSLYNVKFFDGIKNLTGAGNNDFYPYAEGACFGGIRHFFIEEDEYNRMLTALGTISPLTGYNSHAETWESVHTYVWTSKNGEKHDLCDTEIRCHVVVDKEEDSTTDGKMHFELTDSDRRYYLGVVDKYTMLDGDTQGTNDSDYGVETTDTIYTLYSKVPAHTSVLSVIYHIHF